MFLSKEGLSKLVEELDNESNELTEIEKLKLYRREIKNFMIKISLFPFDFMQTDIFTFLDKKRSILETKIKEKEFAQNQSSQEDNPEERGYRKYCKIMDNNMMRIIERLEKLEKQEK